jgi:hypothetical protein
MTTMPLSATTDIEFPSDVAWALTELAPNSPHRREYLLYSQYLAGEQRILFDSADHGSVFRDFLNRLRCNICPAVVSALTDRLTIERIDGDVNAAAKAWELWQDLHLAAVANRVHSEAVGLGDAYVLVWPDDEGVPRPYVHTALEMCHEHDSEKPEIITKAAKLWKDGNRWRLTLYYPDRIEKYRSTTDSATWSTTVTWNATAFERFKVEGEVFPLRNPYGQVPVFHFPYEATTHKHGTSALKDVIPLQDSINQVLVNRAVTIDFAATPMRILIGVETDIDDDPASPNFGLAKNQIKAGVDKFLTFASNDVKIAEFSAAALAPFTEALSTDLNLITLITGIPAHHFQVQSGEWPSGEALKTAEQRLVNRTEDAQTDLTADWSRLLAFMLLIVGIRNAKVRPAWASAQSRNARDEVEIAAVKVERLSVPARKIWKDDLHYSDQEIAEMQAESPATLDFTAIPARIAQEAA